jgi:hypothetical protein
MNLRNLLAAGMFVIIISLRGFALTNGPVQQEYSSFEPVDVTDMVNLPTGDFSYVLPVGDVKGPAGVGYPIVLSYHGGIMNDQEASWVGLGWSLNVGAINRAIRGIPDDYQYDCGIQYIHDSDQGWSLDVGGGVLCVSATVGWSYSGKKGYSFDGITSIGVNYKAGSIGIGATANLRNQSLTLGIGYQMGSAMVGVGVTIDNNGNLSNPSLNISALSGDGPNAKSLASFSISSKGSIGVGVGNGDVGAGGGFGAMSMSSGGMHTSGWGFGITIPIYIFRIDFGYSRWSWQYSDMEYGYNFGYLFQSIDKGFQKVETEDPLFKYNFPYLQKNIIYNGIATLDFTNKSVPSSVVNIDRVYDRSECVSGDDGFSLPAQDIYMTTGQGIGGAFQSFRNHSQKSVMESDANNQKYNGIIGSIASGNGKPGSFYTYDGFFNTDATYFSESFSNGLSFRMLGESSLNLIDNCGETYDLSNAYDNIDKIDANPANTYGTRILPIFGTDPMFPGKLNGFTLTDQEGKTYYYTLPLFSLAKVSYASNKAEPPKSDGFFTFNNTHSYNAQLGGYATTWLLTAVTGPDYIKLSTTNIAPDVFPHNGDLGYWVAFRYEYGDTIAKDGNKIALQKTGKDQWPIQKTSYRWRVPFYDDDIYNTSPSKSPIRWPHISWPIIPKYPHVHDKASGNYYSSFGIKEITYLKSIETPTEVAYFRTSERLDGYGVDDNSYPKFVPDVIKSEDINFPADHLLDYAVGNDRHNIWWGQTNGKSDPSVFVVPPIETDNPTEDDLAQCYTIKFNKNDMTQNDNGPNDFFNLKNGTKLARIEFGGITAYYPDFFWDAGNHEERGAGAAIEIIKDTYRCCDPVSNELISISRAMESGREYSYNGYNFTNYAKCFYAKDDPDNANQDAAHQKIILYITAYSGHRTSAPLACEIRYSHCWDYWRLGSVLKLEVKSALKAASLEKYKNRNPFLRYVKKLDEIAWYSKANYPCVLGGVDPEYNSEKFAQTKPDPYPKPYKRVKFVYNYELASAADKVPFGTVNSMAANRGRLTLKMVRAEAGDPGASVSMPPYIFSYQGKDIPYSGFDSADAWGYRKVPSTTITALNDGVNWNLEQILLPSCGSIKINYERDCAYSSYATMYQLYCDRVTGDRQILPAEDRDIATKNKYYTNPAGYDVVSAHAGEKSLILSNVTGIEQGSYCIIECKTNTVETVNIEVCCGEVADCPPYTPASYTQTNDLDHYHYLYRIDTVCEDNTIILDHALPADGVIAKIYVFKKQLMYGDGIRVKSIECISSAGSINTKYSYPLNGTIQLLPDEIIPIMFKNPFVRFSGGEGDNETGGCQCVNQLFCIDGVRTEKSRCIDYVPFSSDVGKNYNNGNAGVVYPVVEVNQTRSVVDGEDDKDVGLKRYYFYTPDDKITVDGENVHIIDIKQSTSGTPVKQIWDRSGLIGMTKKVEFYNALNQLIYSKENEFTFSEKLATIAGVVNDGLSSAFSDDSKPLGLINQRSVTIDHTGATKSVCDVINSLPFLSSVIEQTQDVVVQTDFGMFNARTGTPILTLSINSDGAKKLNMNVPYNFIANSTAQKAELKKKNMYSLPGGSLIANIAHLIGIRRMSDIDYSSVIGTVDSIKSASAMNYTMDDDPAYALQGHDADGNPVSLQQTRFYLSENDQWKGGGAFAWPLLGGSDYWTRLSNVTRADQFTRPRTEFNAANIPSTAIYHPKLNAVTGVIQNANYYESSVFTGDYYDSSSLDVKSGYFDYENGWERPMATTTPLKYTVVNNEDHHFGKKCIKVVNDSGPICNFKVTKNKPYVLSAWVKITSGTSLKLYIEYRNLPHGQEIMNWPILLTQLAAVYDQDYTEVLSSEATGWTYKEVKIDGSKLTINPGYIRVWIGNPDGVTAYIDDIRFHPDKSPVSSFYYDQELGVPITFVDANNKAKYSKYDEFGRVIEKGVKK